MNLSKRNFIIILTAIAVVVFGLGVLYGQNLAENRDTDVFRASLEAENDQIVVDIKGTVKNPGVYRLPLGTRVGDLLDQAILLEDADTTSINLARKLEDEEVIIVPTLTESAGTENAAASGTTEPASEGSSAVTNAGALSQKVNINTANEALLDTLPGIGPAKASSIINYRLEHGSFSSIEEIMNVSGIGETTFEKMKELITVD